MLRVACFAPVVLLSTVLCWNRNGDDKTYDSDVQNCTNFQASLERNIFWNYKNPYLIKSWKNRKKLG